MLVTAGGALGADSCGGLANAYGPFNYRTDREALAIVERNHFSPEVESLQKGQSSWLGGDIDYVLRASPNHARALTAMMRLAEKEKRDPPQGANYRVACYFERALRFDPKDPVVRIVHASFLHSKDRHADALREMQAAGRLGAKGPDFDYAMGLSHLDAGDAEQALVYAHRAYRAGVTMQMLKIRLVRAGKWREPEPTPPAKNPRPSPTKPQGRS
ncbi:MAG: ABC transporter permease [Burkholderiales bacterium]